MSFTKSSAMHMHSQAAVRRWRPATGERWIADDRGYLLHLVDNAVDIRKRIGLPIAPGNSAIDRGARTVDPIAQHADRVILPM
jgi:hypothetical protein